jgi:hypothetical protein
MRGSAFYTALAEGYKRDKCRVYTRQPVRTYAEANVKILYQETASKKKLRGLGMHRREKTSA